MTIELHEERTDTNNWDTKVRCTCGQEYTSRCELWKHAADRLRLKVITDNYSQETKKMTKWLFDFVYVPKESIPFDFILPDGAIPFDTKHVKGGYFIYFWKLCKSNEPVKL